MAPRLHTLKQRTDFLTVQKRHKKCVRDGFILQVHKRDPAKPVTMPRFGFTATKRVGNAVKRNTAKRRLRELARGSLRQNNHVRADCDYVLIARAGIFRHNFERLKNDLTDCLQQIKFN